MEDEIASYELCKIAQQKGFNIIQRYGNIASLYDSKGNHVYYSNYGMMGSGLSDGYISAPAIFLLQKWLREKHNLSAEARTVIGSEGTNYESYLNCNSLIYRFKTYEQGLKTALETAFKLILNDK